MSRASCGLGRTARSIAAAGSGGVARRHASVVVDAQRRRCCCANTQTFAPRPLCVPQRPSRGGVAASASAAPRRGHSGAASGSVVGSLAPALRAAEVAALATAALVQVAALAEWADWRQQQRRRGSLSGNKKQQQQQQQGKQQQAGRSLETSSAASLQPIRLVTDAAQAMGLPPPSSAVAHHVWSGALLVAHACSTLLRRHHEHRLSPKGEPTADAAVRLVRVEASLQQQAAAAAETARQLDKLQARVRLSTADYKVPLRELQEGAAAQVDALGRLADQQQRTQRQVAGAEEVIAALQAVGARQFQVSAEALAGLRRDQAAVEARIKEQQAELARLRAALVLAQGGSASASASSRAAGAGWDSSSSQQGQHLSGSSSSSNGNGNSNRNGSVGSVPSDPWRSG